jgi:fatty-acyl-CoA synthase
MSDRHFKFWPERVPRHLTVPETSLWFNLEVSASRYPHKASHVFYDRVVTYAQFEAEAERLAGFLQRECGIVRGDRVALHMQNCPQYAIGYYAILRADAVVVPISPMLLTGEVEHIVNDSGVRAVFSSQDLYQIIEPLLGKSLRHAVVACYSDYISPEPSIPVPSAFAAQRQQIRGSGVTLWTSALSMNLKPAPPLANADDACVMPYTSGTTGFPKGCVHKHRSVQFTAMTGPHWCRTFHDEVDLSVLPWFHVTGMQGGINAPIYTGATVVILPRWDRDAAGELIQRYKVSRWVAVPTMVVDFLTNPQLDRYDVSSIRFCAGGGAAMPAAVSQKLETLCGLRYIEGYGLTETAAASHLNPLDNSKQQCLGIPIFDTDSRVVDPATLTELPPGETGEIVTHGPGVFEGYWNTPRANEECFVQIEGKRFFRTGDLARTDEDGYFFMVDRLKRMINAAGFKVWPAEIEALLYAHPAIQEAAVIAKRDARRGESVKAVVILRQATRALTTESEIIDWARQHMAAYKVPHTIEFVEQMPRSAAGKILWRVLQEREDALASQAAVQ